MNIKHLSPQSLWLRFVISLGVLWALGDRLVLDWIDRFFLALLESVLFSILLMLFYMIMVQYLYRKTDLSLGQILVWRGGEELMSLVGWLLAWLAFGTPWSWELLVDWLLREIVVWLARWLIRPGRRRPYGDGDQ